MSRWHDSSCRRPEIAAVTGVPYCHYCSALASLDDIERDAAISLPPIPTLKSPTHLDLGWPSVVNYSRALTDSASCDDGAALSSGPDISQGIRPDESLNSDQPDQCSGHGVSVFPKVPSEGDIRLLRLKPGRFDEPIHALLETVSLRSSQLPTYEALSYTWADQYGDVVASWPVFLGSYWDVLFVTQNCHSALQKIRHTKADRLIWVDALCIEQRSADDKTHQAGLMREIYANACSVIVYLGGATAESDEALNCLERATQEFATGDGTFTFDERAQNLLSLLFQRPYFSRLWVVQEVLVARNLEIICGKSWGYWPRWLSNKNLSDTRAPWWMCKRNSWSSLESHDLLRSLLDTSMYQCADPRDKVFGVLGLVQGTGFGPDYTLPIETVYTGITAFLLKNCGNFEVLGLASTPKSLQNLPSWVPDWSQSLVQEFPDILLHVEDDELDCMELAIDMATPVIFESVLTLETEPDIDVDTGILQIHAIKLCPIRGKKVKIRGHTRILMERERYGTLVLSLVGDTYQIGQDSLFLLNGWDYPVILRYDTDTHRYSFVSACTLSFGPPLDGQQLWLVPWGARSMQTDPDRMSVASFSALEVGAFLTFHSTLIDICGAAASMPPPDVSADAFSIAKNRVLRFVRLTASDLRQLEFKLRQEWDKLNRALRWMFTDQAAVWKTFHDLARTSQEHRQGEGTVQLGGFDPFTFEDICGIEFPNKYSWTLEQFYWSFLRLPAPDAGSTASAENPVVSAMKSHSKEIQKWAEVTAQLLRVFEYSQTVLGSCWDCFPGAQLPKRWLRNWRKFRSLAASALPRVDDESDHSDCLWSWTDFVEVLARRQQLWELQVPPQLDPSVSSKVATCLELELLEVNLDHPERVNIR